MTNNNRDQRTDETVQIIGDVLQELDILPNLTDEELRTVAEIVDDYFLGKEAESIKNSQDSVGVERFTEEIMDLLKTFEAREQKTVSQATIER